MNFDPIFSSKHRRSMIYVAPTGLDELLSITVEDQSSVLEPPLRLWSFITREQAAELQLALVGWLSRDRPIRRPVVETLTIALKLDTSDLQKQIDRIAAALQPEA